MPGIKLEYGTGLPRKYAKQLFIRRTSRGFPLSAKIWSIVNYPVTVAWQEMQKGTSAVEIAKLVRPLLLRDGPAWTTGIKPSVTGKGTIAYNALRLARTEVNQAYHDAQNTAAEGNPLIKGMKWHLSGDHPERDICDDWAEENAHGLGPGIFPVGQTPKDHPNGLCFLTTAYCEPKELRKRLEELYPAEIEIDETAPLMLEKMKKDSEISERLLKKPTSESQIRSEATQRIWDSMTKEEQGNFLSFFKDKKVEDDSDDPFAQLIQGFLGENKDKGKETSEKALKAISDYIHKWAITSGDSDEIAIALQLAAQEEFGLKGANIWWNEDAVSKAKWYLDKGYREPMRIFLRKQYELTQLDFKREGVSSMTLYRGMKFDRDANLVPSLDWNGSIEQVSLDTQPMSSYSSNIRHGRAFAMDGEGEHRVVIAADVPVENILSYCRTGQGTRYEEEFVVMPGVGHGDGFPQWARSWLHADKVPEGDALMEEFAKRK